MRLLHVPSSGPFQPLNFTPLQKVLLSAPNRCRRTDDDAPETSIYSDLFIRTAEDVKADRRERVLDYAWKARKDEGGERRYGKASAVGVITFAFAEEEVWVMIHL